MEDTSQLPYFFYYVSARYKIRFVISIGIIIFNLGSYSESTLEHGHYTRRHYVVPSGDSVRCTDFCDLHQ